MFTRAMWFIPSALVAASAQAQSTSTDGAWTTLPALPPQVLAETAWVRPPVAQAVFLDEVGLAAILRPAPLEDSPAAVGPIVVTFPRPDGTFERFLVVESPILAPDFAAFRPDVKTYKGRGIDDPNAFTRFDVTPDGFHAMVLSSSGQYLIDPCSRNDTAYYTSYFKRDYVRPGLHRWACTMTDALAAQAADPVGIFGERAIVTRRQYRLALAATAEYTAYFDQPGDTDAMKRTRAQNAMITSVNRVNTVYENDLGIRLSLINNTNIIYVNSTTDPYTNDDGGTMLSQNQSNLDTVIGSSGYDIGHVFSTGGGGIAGLGVVCRSGNKARGVTGLGSPVGDPFDIDYVAHEMGHQFNAPHTFAGTGGACDGNASSADAYEPGSGSTIMAYAGICGSDDLQSNSDAYFHHSSIQRIASYITGGSGTCSSNTNTGNNTPLISAGSNLTVPANTPLYLTPASASDPDGDGLTFTWEQRDADVRALPASDPGDGSLFRSRPPTTSSTQYFPPLDDVADGSRDRGDLIPATNRTLNFRLTARDNRGEGGGVTVTTSNRVLTVTTAAGPFAVIFPNNSIALNGNATINVTWSVAGTTGNGVNCANVDILLSTDNGLSFPTVLVTGVPNDGSHPVTLPNIQTSMGRMMVRGSGHAFFDMSDRSFRINQVAAPPATPTAAWASPAIICPGQSTQLFATVGSGEVVDWYFATCGGPSIGTGNPLTISPSSSGVYFAKARRPGDNQSSVDCAQTTVYVGSAPSAPTAASSTRVLACPGDGTVTLSATGGTGTTLRWMSGACDGLSVGVGPSLDIPYPTTTTTYYARWETSCGTSSCATVTLEVAPTAHAPLSATTDRTGFCRTDTGAITLTAEGGSGTEVQWFRGDCGGDLVGTGPVLVVDSPEETTTYFAAWAGPCGRSACASVAVQVSSGPDFNGDSFVDFFDYDDFVLCYEGVGCPPDTTPDFNGDGFVDFFDYDDFVAAFEQGC